MTFLSMLDVLLFGLAQEAFAMAANCALEAHLKHDHVPSLSLAQHMLQQARAIADKLTKLPHGPSDTQNSKIPTFLLQMVGLRLHHSSCQPHF